MSGSILRRGCWFLTSLWLVSGIIGQLERNRLRQKVLATLQATLQPTELRLLQSSKGIFSETQSYQFVFQLEGNRVEWILHWTLSLGPDLIPFVSSRAKASWIADQKTSAHLQEFFQNSLEFSLQQTSFWGLWQQSTISLGRNRFESENIDWLEFPDGANVSFHSILGRPFFDLKLEIPQLKAGKQKLEILGWTSWTDLTSPGRWLTSIEVDYLMWADPLLKDSPWKSFTLPHIKGSIDLARVTEKSNSSPPASSCSKWTLLCAFLQKFRKARLALGPYAHLQLESQSKRGNYQLLLHPISDPPTRGKLDSSGLVQGLSWAHLGPLQLVRRQGSWLISKLVLGPKSFWVEGKPWTRDWLKARRLASQNIQATLKSGQISARATKKPVAQ